MLCACLPTLCDPLLRLQLASQNLKNLTHMEASRRIRRCLSVFRDSDGLKHRKPPPYPVPVTLPSMCLKIVPLQSLQNATPHPPQPHSPQHFLTMWHMFNIRKTLRRKVKENPSTVGMRGMTPMGQAGTPKMRQREGSRY